MKSLRNPLAIALVALCATTNITAISPRAKAALKGAGLIGGAAFVGSITGFGVELGIDLLSKNITPDQLQEFAVNYPAQLKQFSKSWKQAGKDLGFNRNTIDPDNEEAIAIMKYRRATAALFVSGPTILAFTLFGATLGAYCGALNHDAQQKAAAARLATSQNQTEAVTATEQIKS